MLVVFQGDIICEVASSLRQLEFGFAWVDTPGHFCFCCIWLLCKMSSLDVAQIVCFMPTIHNYTQLPTQKSRKKPSSELDRLSSCVEDIIKSRRGQVKIIRSENATNFKSGESELRESINARFTTHYCRKTSNGASILQVVHISKAYGNAASALPKILQALLQMQTIDNKSLPSLMCEVESIMNGRPLTTVSTDQRDLEALTPNHLLFLQSQPQLPPGLFSEEDCFCCRRLKQVHYL